MTEYIEVRSVKPRRSHKRSQAVTTIEIPSDSSDDTTSSDDDGPIVVELPSKTNRKSRRHKSKQALPIIVNTQPVKEKKRHHRKHVQQFLINAQPTMEPSVKKEVLIQPVIDSSLNPSIQYVPVRSSAPALQTIFESRHHRYRTLLEPTLVDELPVTVYDPLVYPLQRRIVTEPSNSKTVHLPRHAQKLVNRFLSGMERAHAHRYGCDSDSDCSIDDCRVCRRVRSVMDGRRRSTSVFHRHHHHHRDRCVYEIEDSPRHDHCRHCDACDLFRKSDVVISHTGDHSLSHSKRHGRHVRIIETSPSRASKPRKEKKTTTTTTTTTRPDIITHHVPVPQPVPYQMPYYPTTYPPYTDPNYGSTYNGDPNWPYYSYGPGANYDYSSYYTQPVYPQHYQPYHGIPTTTTVPSDEVIVEETQPHRRRKPTGQTLVVHRSAEETVPESKTVVERTHRSRRPRKVHATTIVKEQTRAEPIATSTTDLRT